MHRRLAKQRASAPQRAAHHPLPLPTLCACVDALWTATLPQTVPGPPPSSPPPPRATVAPAHVPAPSPPRPAPFALFPTLLLVQLAAAAVTLARYGPGAAHPPFPACAPTAPARPSAPSSSTSREQSSSGSAAGSSSGSTTTRGGSSKRSTSRMRGSSGSGARAGPPSSARDRSGSPSSSGSVQDAGGAERLLHPPPEWVAALCSQVRGGQQVKAGRAERVHTFLKAGVAVERGEEGGRASHGVGEPWCAGRTCV